MEHQAFFKNLFNFISFRPVKVNAEVDSAFIIPTSGTTGLNKSMKKINNIIYTQLLAMSNEILNFILNFQPFVSRTPAFCIK